MIKILHSHLVIDTCCMLNFCASGELLSILKSVQAQSTITAVVQQEELLTLKKIDHQINSGAEQLETAISEGVIEIVDFESDAEEAAFINYVAELGDDGESATGAIAVNRNWAIATDDRAATKFFKREAPKIQILSTPELIRNWAESEALSTSDLRLILDRIAIKGRYIPARNHPLKSWWQHVRQLG
jgi:hypothetical protein